MLPSQPKGVRSPNADNQPRLSLHPPRLELHHLSKRKSELIFAQALRGNRPSWVRQQSRSKRNGVSTKSVKLRQNKELPKNSSLGWGRGLNRRGNLANCPRAKP